MRHPGILGGIRYDAAMRIALLVGLVACGDNLAQPDARHDDARADAAIDMDIDAASFCGDGVVDDGEDCDTGLRGLSGDGCSSTCRTETLVVHTPTRETMVPRTRHGLAYDSSRERTVMFGGEAATGSTWTPNDETWEFDGTTWQQKTPAVHPSARIDAAMFYENGRVILFGGEGLDDTWAWDGTTWTPLIVSTVPTGTIAGAAYDRQRNVGVLITSTGTWEWNGTTWSLASSTALLGVVAYAGSGRVAVIDTVAVHFWNGTVWTDVSAPEWATAVAGAAYDSVDDRLLATAYDLRTTSLAQQVFAWNGSAWTLEPSTGDAPSLRQSPVVFDDDANALVMFGAPAMSGNDTWIWDGSWHPHRGDAPPPRFSSALAFDTRRGQVVMFSGNGQTMLRDDTWRFRDNTWTEVLDANTAEPRISLATAFDEDRGVLVVYGGQLNYGHFTPEQFVKAEDLWELDGTTWTREVAPTPIPPEGSIAFAAAYDRANHYTIIVTAERTLTWDGTTLVERTPPPDNAFPSLAHDAKRGVTVLLDGGELYEWTGALWMHHAVPQSLDGQLVYDPLRAVILIVQNQGIQAWNGSTVTPLSTSGVAVPIIFDRASRGLFHFGAPSGWDTMIARWQSDEVDERCDGTDADLDGLVRCGDPDCWWRCTPRCPPYASCDPAAPHCGDGTCSELEDAALCPADCP